MFRKKENAAAALAVTKNSYVPVDSDFVLKDNAGDVEIDTNFAAQSFWREVVIRFFRKKSGVFGTVMILLIIHSYLLKQRKTAISLHYNEQEGINQYDKSETSVKKRKR